MFFVPLWLTGAQIDVLARTDLVANADGDSSEDVDRDFARVKTLGNATIDILGASNSGGLAPTTTPLLRKDCVSLEICVSIGTVRIIVRCDAL